MHESTFKRIGLRLFTSAYAWYSLGASFFLGNAWLMERHGIRSFEYVGGRFNSGTQTATPGMLYAAGWAFVGLMVIRALRRRMAEVKAYRAKSGERLLPGE